MSRQGEGRGSNRPRARDLDPWRLRSDGLGRDGHEHDTDEPDADETNGAANSAANSAENTGRIPDPQPEHTPLFRLLASILIRVEATLRARGGAALRRTLVVLGVLVGMVGAFLLVGPIVNEPMSFDDVIEAADVDTVDWVARDAVIRYDISRDADGSFVARVSERYTADFRNGPERAVERVLPLEFEGGDVRLEVTRTAIDGADARLSRKDHGTHAVLELESPDGSRLDGEREIVIEYELRNLAVPEADEATGDEVENFDWNVFAVDWPQAVKGLTVEVTLPEDLDSALVRAPRASVSWLLVSGISWIEPDDELTTASTVGYSFTNDQGLPPHADARVLLSFPAGTFEMPPHTTLFWWQTYGPILPLALLVVLLPFALAARAVAWADVHGRPWIEEEYDPPKGVGPRLAAQLVRAPFGAELAAELEALRPLRGRSACLASLARTASRTGRAGNALSALRAYLFGPERREALTRGLRRIPSGYVRDAFIVAPLALTLLQWGLVRQLSHQRVLAVVWWPTAFFWLTVAISAVVLWIALTARPLTLRGALIAQHLRGVELYAGRTLLLDRGPLDDPLLPYAALFGRPRSAGESVRRLAVAESGDREADRGWRDEHFIAAPVTVSAVLAVALLGGAVATLATQPYPYPVNYDTEIFDHDLPGTLGTTIHGFEADAELRREADGSAVLTVRERLEADFEPGGRVPQFAREWPDLRYGQSLGLRVDEVRIDGQPVPFREIPRPRSTGMVTQLTEVLEGRYQVEVDYALASAAVAAERDGEPVEQVRWAAVYDGWDSDIAWGYNDDFSARIELTVAPDLADEMVAGGWLTRDYEAPRVRFERGEGIAPWHQSAELDGPDAPATVIGAESRQADGSLRVAIEPRRESEYGDWAGPFFFSDLGAVLDFPEGTFAGPDRDAARADEILYQVPTVVVLGLALALNGGAIWAFVAGRRRKTPRAGLSLRTLSFFVLPVAGTGQFLLFYWMTSDMPGDDGRFALVGWPTLLAIVLGAAQLWSVIARPRSLSHRPATERMSG